jgi:hypothetical protein
MEPDKETWISTVMGSLEGLQRAEPSPFLFAKIRNRLTARPALHYVPTRTIWLTAASFVLLAGVNWQVYSRFTAPPRAETNAQNTIIAEMNLYPTNTNPYNAWNGQSY